MEGHHFKFCVHLNHVKMNIWNKSLWLYSLQVCNNVIFVPWDILYENKVMSAIFEEHIIANEENTPCQQKKYLISN